MELTQLTNESLVDEYRSVCMDVVNGELSEEESKYLVEVEKELIRRLGMND